MVDNNYQTLDPTGTYTKQMTVNEETSCSDSIFLPCQSYSTLDNLETTPTTLEESNNRSQKEEDTPLTATENRNSSTNLDWKNSPVTCDSVTTSERWEETMLESSNQCRETRDSSVEASSPVAVLSSSSSPAAFVQSFISHQDGKSNRQHLGCLPFDLVKSYNNAKERDSNGSYRLSFESDYSRDNNACRKCKEDSLDSTETRHSSTDGKTPVASKWITVSSMDKQTQPKLATCCEIM